MFPPTNRSRGPAPECPDPATRFNASWRPCSKPLGRPLLAISVALECRLANDAVDSVRSKMDRRRTRAREGHGYVRKLYLGPSGDADLQRGWPLSLKWRGGSVAGNAGLADDYQTDCRGRAVGRADARV